jgi:DNA (cytosine-5)-methyltransferase 1
MGAREIILDSFAGGGGASLGIEMALGRSPDVAINHDADALAMHEVNHPATLHLNSNIWQVNPDEVMPGQPIGLMWASPDCKHHSKAKGGKPLSRNIRDLAWVVVLWAKRRRPRVICLENVEEFRDWGPLCENDRPIPERKGETFAKWTGELKKLGYKVEWRELRACDYGAPTIRKRLFLIARCDGRPIVWPAPTHGNPKSDEVKSGKLLPWRTAAEIIDWSLPCYSIFLTREEGRAVGVNRPLADATMARIAKGVQRYVIDAAEPFIVTCNHGGDHFRGQGLGEPFNTVTAARDAHGLVVPIMTYGQQGGANRAASDPLHTVTASTKDTNAVIAATISRQFGQSVGSAINHPIGTVTAGGGGKSALAAVHLTKFSENSTGHLPDEPLHTVMAGAPRHGVVAAFLAQHNGGTCPGARAADEPVSTVMATGAQQAVVSAGLVSLKGSDRRASDIEAPHPTVTAQGMHSAEVRAFLVKYYGQGGQDQTPADPLHTVPTKARFGLVMVKGEPYEIVDIGMRMLRPRELFRAQGFPDSYVIDRRPDGSKLTGTSSVRMCGNSVSPVMAKAIVGANYVSDEVEIARGRKSNGTGRDDLFVEAAE